MNYNKLFSTELELTTNDSKIINDMINFIDLKIIAHFGNTVSLIIDTNRYTRIIDFTNDTLSIGLKTPMLI